MLLVRRAVPLISVLGSSSVRHAEASRYGGWRLVRQRWAAHLIQRCWKAVGRCLVLERWAAGQRLVRERWAELHIQWWWLVGAAAVLAEVSTFPNLYSVVGFFLRF